MAAQEGEYQRGAMDTADQKATFAGFIAASVWGSALTGLIVLFLSLVFAANLPWVACLFGVAAIGIFAGLLLRLGGAWYATVVGLSIVGLITGGVASLLANVG